MKDEILDYIIRITMGLTRDFSLSQKAYTDYEYEARHPLPSSAKVKN
jgi:hypothetical protein